MPDAALNVTLGAATAAANAAVAITGGLRPAAAAPATFGRTTIGATISSFPLANTLSGSHFTLTEHGRVTRISVYFKGTDALHEGGPAKVLIYAVNGGVPTALLVTSLELTVLDNVDGWQDFIIPPVVLPPATYCLAILSGNRLMGAMSAAGTNHFRATGTTPYASGPPNPFGTPTSSTNQKSIYATYTPVPPQLSMITWNVSKVTPTLTVPFVITMDRLVDVIAMQEVQPGQVAGIKSALLTGTGVPWDGPFQAHCDTAVGDVCTLDLGDGVVLLSKWPITAQDTHFLKFEDDFGVAWRAGLAITINVSGRLVTVFCYHGPAGTSVETQANKVLAIADWKTWAAGFASPRLVGGDFNMHAQPPDSKPTNDAYSGLLDPTNGVYADAWPQAPGIGNPSTRPNEDRIDFWLADTALAALVATRLQVGASADVSDHFPVRAIYELAAPAITLGALTLGAAAIVFTPFMAQLAVTLGALTLTAQAIVSAGPGLVPAGEGSEVDNALIAKLGADATLLALVPNGVYWEEAPPGSTRFVIVSLVDHHDEPEFGRCAYEDALYLVKAVVRKTIGVDPTYAAAARIHALLEDGTLVVPGYQLMTMHREARVRMTEVDDHDESIRWQHRGGEYRVQVARN